MDKYFSTRRTRRNFEKREVPATMIRDIVAAAMRAPTTGNMQLYSVIVSRGGERRQELNALHFNQPAAVNADVLLTVCADFGRFSRWCKASDADPGYDNFLSFKTAVTDATILAQQIVTIAEQEGLGTCYLGTVDYNAAEIGKLLNLPPLCVPVCCLAIGWAADEGEETERLGVDAVLYDDRYPDFTDDDIRRLYKPKDDFPANAGYVAEHGKKNIAQVFTDIRYPREMNESVSPRLLAYLRAQGFLPPEK